MKDDDKVIDLVEVIRKRKMEKVKKELDNTIYDLDIDIEKILSTFVIFDTVDYNQDIHTSISEKQMIINNLIFTVASLDLLGLHEAAEEIQSVINKLNNNSYGDDNENQT